MIEIDERDQQYAIDVITGRSASYDLTFSDERTTRAELDQYLLFAVDIGLDLARSTRAAIAPVLESRDGSYGKIEGAVSRPVPAGGHRGPLPTAGSQGGGQTHPAPHPRWRLCRSGEHRVRRMAVLQ
jgi:hypothetical protein